MWWQFCRKCSKSLRSHWQLHIQLHTHIFQDLHEFNHLPLDKMATILADNIFKYIFLNEKYKILIGFSLKFVPRSPIDNKTALVQVMALKAITWTNADPVHQHIYVAQRGDELNDTSSQHPLLSKSHPLPHTMVNLLSIMEALILTLSSVHWAYLGLYANEYDGWGNTKFALCHKDIPIWTDSMHEANRGADSLGSMISYGIMEPWPYGFK